MKLFAAEFELEFFFFGHAKFNDVGAVIGIVVGVSGVKRFSLVLGYLASFLVGQLRGKLRDGTSRTRADSAKKAGFGEGTPQQVRPERESQFQIVKLWPQVDTCLPLFLSDLKIQIQKRAAKLEVQVHRSVSCLRGSPFTPDEVPAPVLQRRCQARPHGCGVVALYPIQTAYAAVKVHIKNCRPVVWLQVSRNKRNRPAWDQRILS